MIAIHDSKNGFCLEWIKHCNKEGIPYKLVNCYDTDIIEQLADCDALMWQHNHGYPTDKLIGKPLLHALHHAGMPVFPDFESGWHFDDKIAQKYLLEKLGIAMAPTSVFFSKAEAMAWIDTATFPKVFKLRGGAGAKNVQLVHTREQARKLTRKAFGSGFRPVDSWAMLKDTYQKYTKRMVSTKALLKAIAHLVYPYQIEKAGGREKGYVYFQEFIEGNDHDIRVYIVNGRAFAILRKVREGDFRASGSGMIEFGKEFIDEKIVALAFRYAKLLGSSCVNFDFVLQDGKPLVLEMSYGFVAQGCEPCVGHWTEDMAWHPGKIDPGGWMVEYIRDQIAAKEGVV